MQLRARSGLTLYAIARDLSGNAVTTGGIVQPENDENWTAYAIPFKEIVPGSGVYFAQPPFVNGFRGLIAVMVQEGSSPATTDPACIEGVGPAIWSLDYRVRSGPEGVEYSIESFAPLNDPAERQIQVPSKFNSLAFAQRVLETLYTALVEIQARGTVSVTIGTTATTFTSLSALNDAIASWEARVARLSGVRRRINPIRLFSR